MGIDKTNPDDLSDEEKGKFARLDFDISTITWQRGNFKERKRDKKFIFGIYCFYDYKLLNIIFFQLLIQMIDIFAK